MPKNKKSTSTSKKVKGLTLDGQPRQRKKQKNRVSTIKFQRKYPGQDPHIDFKPPPGLDPEEVNPEPDDEASKHKYPPPKKNPLFREKWLRFIDNVTKRDNFNVAHLDSLEILCDLYVEYDDLQAFVRTNGRSYCSIGRQGEVWKFYPEVAQLNKVQDQIKGYSKMLGLVLKKDHGVESGGEEKEWE
jgi:hypothetical protein